MKSLYVLVAGIVISAFFTSGPSFAVEDRAPQHVCAKETQETRLKKGIEESPDLVMAVIEGKDLDIFSDRMRKQHMLVGSVGFNKVYVFYSEHHPTWVYVYFLTDECIIDVKFTFKNLVEYFITGDEQLIRRQ